MRLLAGADFHGSLPHYRWFLEEAETLEVDALILAGDLLGYADEVDDPDEDQQLNAAQIEDLFRPWDLPVLFIMGNDDHFDIEETWKGWTPIHGRRVALEGFHFVGYQYSLPWMGGVFEKPEEEIAEDLVGVSDLLDERTVFVSHSPAQGILDPGVGPREIGSRSLRQLVDRRPLLAHIHGHCHSGFGRHGCHFNVALALRKRAILIDIPSVEHQMVQGGVGSSRMSDEASSVDRWSPEGSEF